VQSRIAPRGRRRLAADRCHPANDWGVGWRGQGSARRGFVRSGLANLVMLCRRRCSMNERAAWRGRARSGKSRNPRCGSAAGSHAPMAGLRDATQDPTDRTTDPADPPRDPKTLTRPSKSPTSGGPCAILRGMRTGILHGMTRIRTLWVSRKWGHTQQERLGPRDASYLADETPLVWRFYPFPLVLYLSSPGRLRHFPGQGIKASPSSQWLGRAGGRRPASAEPGGESVRPC
jgi:hypothetical protein